MGFFITILALVSGTPMPDAVVQTEEAEVEAFFVPAGFVGPVIAIPLDVEVF